jgi:ADP-heptose:LPS heptosyltransferase
MKKKKPILIISTQGLGDIIMLYPCLKILDEKKINFDILVKDNLSRGLLNEFKFCHLNNIYTYRNIYFIFLNYDLIIPQCSISPLKYFIFSVSMRNFKNIIKRYNYIKILSSQYLHNSVKNFNLFKYFIPDHFNISENTFIKNYRYKKHQIKYKNHNILIAPGGGMLEQHKHLSAECISKIIYSLYLNDKTYNYIIVGGKDNLNLSNEIIKIVNNYNLQIEIISYVGKTNFEELFNLIFKSKIVLTSCNGISHIAGFLGATVYGFYGPTNPMITGPFTEELYVSKTELNCAPCYSKKNWRGCQKPSCMKNFDHASSVMNIVKLLKS